MNTDKKLNTAWDDIVGIKKTFTPSPGFMDKIFGKDKKIQTQHYKLFLQDFCFQCDEQGSISITTALISQLIKIDIFEDEYKGKINKLLLLTLKQDDLNQLIFRCGLKTIFAKELLSRLLFIPDPIDSIEIVAYKYLDKSTQRNFLKAGIKFGQNLDIAKLAIKEYMQLQEPELLELVEKIRNNLAVNQS